MTNETVPAIELQELVKFYGSFPAVNGVSFTVPKGELFGLIGPNGAGKTTTFSVLAGFLRASAGRARVLGEDPQAVSKLKGRVGVLPQDALLPSHEPVGAFLMHLARLQGLSRSEAEAEARRVLEAVGGADWWTKLCGGLSHGMTKRVGLAQALLGKPELLLLDEPTAGLDPKVAYQLRQFVKGLQGQFTILISSHNLHELEELCTSAAIIDRGRLVQAGTMVQLTASAQQFRVGLSPGPVPLDAVRAILGIKTVHFDQARGELVVSFDPGRFDAEGAIAQVLRVLLDQQARISGLAKGQRLEETVMQLT